jgi:hypothetical protein
MGARTSTLNLLLMLSLSYMWKLPIIMKSHGMPRRPPPEIRRSDMQPNRILQRGVLMGKKRCRPSAIYNFANPTGLLSRGPCLSSNARHSALARLMRRTWLGSVPARVRRGGAHLSSSSRPMGRSASRWLPTAVSVAEVDAHVCRVESFGSGVRFHRLPTVDPPTDCVGLQELRAAAVVVD